MVEAAVALIIALVAFAVGYGNLQGIVKANKITSDERYALVQKEIDVLKENHDTTNKSLTEIKIMLQRLSSDIHYLKEKLDDK